MMLLVAQGTASDATAFLAVVIAVAAVAALWWVFRDDVGDDDA